VARPDKIETALLDASALLGVIKGDEAFLPLRSLLAAVDRGEVRLVESTAILAEVLVAHPNDTTDHVHARNTVRDLLESKTTELVDVSTTVARKAGELRVSHGLKTWDAVHLATAIVAGVDVLVVRDRGFPEGDFEGVFVTGPFDLAEGKLFDLDL
jgi:predicted nucleic acid-binding protein